MTTAGDPVHPPPASSSRSRSCSGSCSSCSPSPGSCPAIPAARSSANEPPTRCATTSSTATGSTSRSPSSSSSYLQQLASGDLGVSIKHSRAGDPAAHRAPPDDHRADDPGDDLRGRRRRPARPHLGLPAQLDGRRRHDGLRQPRRLDPGLRARAAARLPVRRRPQGHAVRAAAIRSPELRRGRRAAGRRLGSAGLDRTAAGDPRLRVGHLHLQLVHHRPMGRDRRRLPPPDPAGHRARHDPARDHRPDHALEPARGPRPRLRPDRPRQGPRRARASSCATRPATRCCRSSRSSASSSARCCPARS